MSRVTIQDVADRLNLTKGTVSRALNNYPDIAINTRRRVAQQALQMGYRPSSQAQGLRTGITKSVGLVLNMDKDNTHKPFLSDFLDGISSSLSLQGWTLTVSTAVSISDTLDKHRNLIIDQKVDGFILPRTATQDTRVHLLKKANIPFVLYGRHQDTAGCSWFDIEGEQAMKSAVSRLKDFGHTRIAYIGGDRSAYFEILRKKGYCDEMKTLGITIDKELLRDNAMTEQSGYNAAISLLNTSSPPTALLCALDRAALGSYKAIQSLGLVVGSDVSVIGYDGIPEGQYANPSLTTFSVDNRQAGEQLAKLLLRNINGENPENLRALTQATLTERQSDGPIKHQSSVLAKIISSNASNIT